MVQRPGCVHTGQGQQELLQGLDQPCSVLSNRQSFAWLAIAGSTTSKSRRRHVRDAWGCLVYPELKREERHGREHDRTL